MSDSKEKDSKEDSKKDNAEILRAAMNPNHAPMGNSASMNRSGRNNNNSFVGGRGCGRSAGRKR